MGSPHRSHGATSLCRCLVVLSVPVVCAAQPDSLQVGAVDFFGTAGIDLTSIRAAVPLHPGDTIAMANAADVKRRVTAAVTRAGGAPPTGVSTVCCDPAGRLLIYIGLPGHNVRTVAYLPPPSGSSCVPDAGVQLYDRAMAALQKAIEAGDTAEDMSSGYALAHHPQYRDAQLALREYAVAHGPLLRTALRGCGRAENRAAAAQLLGYASRSRAQIDALVRAARDSDAAVRNNVVRALWVLASSRDPTTVAMIPSAPFIEMLSSGVWEDRNKAGLLLSTLITMTSANALADMRRNAMDSLVEMARWQDAGHAYPYRVLLGRLAGFDDRRLNELISAGEVQAIIDAAQRR
jgi:hypothetical protein